MGFARPDTKRVTDARTEHRPQTARYPGKVTTAGARSEQGGTGPHGEEESAVFNVPNEWNADDSNLAHSWACSMCILPSLGLLVDVR